MTRFNPENVRAPHLLRHCVLAFLLAFSVMLLMVMGLFLNFQSQLSAATRELESAHRLNTHVNALSVAFNTYQQAAARERFDTLRLATTRKSVIAAIDNVTVFDSQLGAITRTTFKDYERLTTHLREAQQLSDTKDAVKIAAEIRSVISPFIASINAASERSDKRSTALIAEIQAFQSVWQERSTVLMLACLVLVVVGAVVLMVWVLGPIVQITRALEALSQREPLPRTPKVGELGLMAKALDSLQETIQREHDLAYVDTLTGLGTQAKFVMQTVAHDVTHERWVMVLHLHRLNVVASVHGVAASEQCIRDAGHRLLHAVGEAATPVRYNGTRFASLLSLASGSASPQVLLRAETIRKLVAAPVQLVSGHIVHMDAKVGLARLGDMHCETLRDALGSAETAITYQRNRGDAQAVAIHSLEIRESFARDATLSRELDLALREQQIVAFYQPVVDVAKGVVVGVEALARWQHPARGLLLPYHFVPLAERTGQIQQIDSAMFAVAFAQLKQWHDGGHALQLSFNLSPSEINGTILGRIRHALQTSSLPPRALVAELTETGVISNSAETRELVESLHRLGAEICLDDFGTGYSSLSYLLNLPIAKVKIDRSFVMAIGQSAAAERIIEATLQLAKSMGLLVVAEGVETLAQMRWLQTRGCNLHQGWLYAKAQSASDFAQWMTQAPAQIQALQSASHHELSA